MKQITSVVGNCWKGLQIIEHVYQIHNINNQKDWLLDNYNLPGIWISCRSVLVAGIAICWQLGSQRGSVQIAFPLKTVSLHGHQVANKSKPILKQFGPSLQNKSKCNETLMRHFTTKSQKTKDSSQKKEICLESKICEQLKDLVLTSLQTVV